MTTDELRAKFEAWATCQEFSCYRSPKNPTFYWSILTNELWDAWQAAHASRDAEVEDLIRKYEKRSMYEDGGLYSIIIDDLQEFLGK